MDIFNHGAFKFQDCMGDAIHAVYPLSRFATIQEDLEQGTDFIFGAKNRIDYRIDFTINPDKSHCRWTREIVRLGGIEHVVGVRLQNCRVRFKEPVYVIKPCNMHGFHRFSYNVSRDEVYDLIETLARVEELVMVPA